MSRLIRLLHRLLLSFITQLILGALLVGAIDATLLWDVMRHIPPDDGLDALGVMLTIIWFMIAAWAIMTWRNHRRDDRRGGGEPPSEKYPRAALVDALSPSLYITRTNTHLSASEPAWSLHQALPCPLTCLP